MARGKYKRKRERAALLRLSLEHLGLSGRVENLLKKNELNTIQDVIGKNKDELLSISGLGAASLEEIENRIRTVMGSN